MATGTRICKICGKEYTYCKTWVNADKFRYQDVACSPKCGAEYFAKIAASRSEQVAPQEEAQSETKPAKKIAKKASKKIADVEPKDSAFEDAPVEDGASADGEDFAGEGEK